MEKSHLNRFWYGKKVLITGHTGFKGSWLSIFLYLLGAKIIGISKDKNDGIYKLAKLRRIYEKEYFIDLSKVSDKKLDNIFNENKPQIIFHFAAQAIVSEAHYDPLGTVNSNLISTLNLLLSLERTDACKNITISTTDKVYKDSTKFNIETSELGGSEFYSFSKVAVENIIKLFIERNPDKFCISTVRSGNVIGGGDRGKDRITTDLLNNYYFNRPLFIRNKHSIRPWQYILDSIYGYMLVAEENFTNKKSEVYNLNSKVNNSFTVEYFLNSFEKISGKKLNIKYSKTKFKENEILRLNSQKAKKNLGWKPVVELFEIVEKLFFWEESVKLNEVDPLVYSKNEIQEYIVKNKISFYLHEKSI